MWKICKIVFKSILWTVLAVVLLITATLICVVNILTPEKLTPIVERFANNYLSADVSLGRVELAFAPSFPTLRVNVDSVTVVSRAFDILSPEERAKLPAYADTVVTFEHFSGAIAIDRFLTKKEIALRDVILRGPEVNIVIASDSLVNYDLLVLPPDTTETASEIPAFSIDHFAIEDARAFRYYNAIDSLDATVLLLRDAGIDGTHAPSYTIKIGGNIQSPDALSALDLTKLSFGADGRVRWEPSQPALVAFEEFTVSTDFVTAKVDAEIDMSDNFVIPSAKFELLPIKVNTLLEFVPEVERRKYKLNWPYFETPAEIVINGQLTQPFNLSRDSIPFAQVNVAIPETPLTYGKLHLKNLSMNLGVTLAGDNLDNALVDLRSFTASGPATSLRLEAKLNEIISDPRFDACLQLKSDIAKMPKIVADIAGGYLRGMIDADIDVRGRQSMFEPKDLHKLDVEGAINLNNFYYLSNDTNTMAEMNKASIKFGSGVRLQDKDGAEGPRTLAAGLNVDTANILANGISMGISNIMLGLGVENSKHTFSGDSTIVVPLGGLMKVGRFNVLSISDSAGMNLRGLEGHVGVHRYRDRARLPLFNFDLTAKRVSAGAPEGRVILTSPKITLEAHKIPRRRGRVPRDVKRWADSIATAHPELSPDSVYRLALEKRRHRPGEKVHHRIHTELTPEETEIMYWGTTKAVRQLLLDWDIRGSLTTKRARFYSPVFPLRNRISNVDVRFNNDSILLSDIRLRSGHSDLTLNGILSNMKQGFTSKGFRSPLKINMLISSRVIDVNELAAAAFAGAAYADKMRKGTAVPHIGLEGLDDDENSFDKLESLHNSGEETGPFLLPTNIDAHIDIEADTIHYSDLALRGLDGEVLLFNGALNLHDLKCTSDIGSLTLDALYNAPGPEDMKFGFSLDARRFDIAGFLKLVPAIDSIMPLMRDFGGVISAGVTATCDVDTAMNLVLPSLDAAVRLQGDSLRFIDPKTYRTIGKWLGFKDKEDNVIKSLDVEMTVRDDILQIYPFMLDIDRYELGVQGYNDLNLNFDYHIAVLKSPIPFKFGVTVKGNPEKYKVRFGGAKFKADAPAASMAIVDTARVSLISQIQNIFRRGVNSSRFAHVNFGTAGERARQAARHQALEFSAEDTLSRSDSLFLVEQGVLEAPQQPQTSTEPEKKNAKKRKSKSDKPSDEAIIREDPLLKENE